MPINLTATGKYTREPNADADKVYTLEIKKPVKWLSKKQAEQELAKEFGVDLEKLKAEERNMRDILELESYKENEINWLENEWYDSWELKIKGRMKNLWKHKKEYIEDDWKKFFLAHSKDTIVGKPQLIDNVQRTIPLVRLAVKKITPKKNDPDFPYTDMDGTVTIQSFFFFDEKFDKRHDGFQQDCFALDFWVYRIISEEGKEYFVWTQQQLPNELCTLKGMLVELSDFAEMSRSLKIPSVSKIFFMKECEPAVQIVTKEQLIKFTQEKEITQDDWLDLLSFHKSGNQNRFPLEFELLKSSQILSGKKDGYPLHLSVMGVAGTMKTMGIVETTAYKFEEEPTICEGGNSRIKALTPSFKEKPANIGYLAKANRMAFVDEIGKMVEFELNKHQTTQGNVMGELNGLLEHKRRMVGSGNDNEITVQATAKCLFVTNPITNKNTIHSHIGVIDKTTMSRMVWWVQDNNEQQFLMKEGVIRNPPTPTQAHQQTKDNGNILENRKNDIVLKKCWGKVDRNQFLTLFDTCYSFTSEIDEERVQKLADTISLIAREPMRSDVWKPRSFHHVFLLVDGLCKQRCLFKDYDTSFIATDEDYNLAEAILIRMVNGWETKFQQDGML